MTNYSLNPGHVRGDVFSITGKWRYTLTIDMSERYNDIDLHRAVVRAVRETPDRLRGIVDAAVGPMANYVLVVLEPYHRNAHPVMVHLYRYDVHHNYHHSIPAPS